MKLLMPVLMMLASAAAAAPAETRVPTMDILNRFRAKGIAFSLDGKALRATLQQNRGGELHLIVAAEGGNVHEAQAVPILLFERGYDQNIAGVPCSLALSRRIEDQELLVTPRGGETVALALGEIRRSVYDAAIPVEALGPQWRLVYQSEVWATAGMHSFVFLEDYGATIKYHLVNAEPINWTRETVRPVGSRTVGLLIDSHNQLVIRPLE